MSRIDWAKAPEWAKELAINPHGVSAWLGDVGYAYLTYIGSFHEWSGPSTFPRDRFKVVESRPVVWGGDGLPPVGVVCEHSTDANTADADDGEWKEVQILAHHQFHTDEYVCAIWVSGAEVSYSSEGGHFRPIRAPEQIAAEEHIDAIHKLILDRFGISDRDAAKTLYLHTLSLG